MSQKTLDEVKAQCTEVLALLTPRDELASDGADETGAVRGFMCLIDWQHEVGFAVDGNKVYPSLKNLQEHHPMWAECGVVEVQLRAVQVVAPQRLFQAAAPEPPKG